MKKIYLLYSAMALQLNCFAQATTSFVRLPVTLGYIIDSTENKEKDLITFLPEKRFKAGALLQLADSSIVFRILTTDEKTIRNINFSKVTATDFIKGINNKLLSNAPNSAIPESEFYQLLSDSGTSIKFITLADLYEKQSVALQQVELSKMDTTPFLPSTRLSFTTGIGAGLVKAGTGGLSTGIKVTFIYKHITAGIRYCGSRNINLFSSPDEFTHDVSLLFGVHYLRYNFYGSLLMGVSYITHQFDG